MKLGDLKWLPALAGIAFFYTTSAFGEVPAYKLVKDKSSIKFFAIQNNAPVEGRFDNFTADIRFDPEHADQSSITAEVSVGSVASDHEAVASNLKLPEWLSEAAFPKATFRSTKLLRMPNTNNYIADGEITLKGKTEPATINFQLEMIGNRAIAKGAMTLQRKDFDIGQGEWAKDDVIKNEVRLELRIVADKVQ